MFVGYWAARLFMQELFVFWMLTMTCQSSLLIRVLNELCFPVWTLESDVQLPRQLQFIWQHARETALPYFSGSSTVLKVEDIPHLKVSILFYFILFYSIRLWPSLIIFSMLNQSLKKNFSKWSLSTRKETPKISACVSLQTVLWACASTPHHIKMPHSKIKELICREENSVEAQWAWRLSRGWCCKTRGVKQCLITKGLCAVFVPVVVICSSMSFSTLFSVSPHCKALYCSSQCCWSSWCMGNQWCCSESIWVYLQAMIHITSPPAPPPLL